MTPIEGGYKGYYCFENYWQAGKLNKVSIIKTVLNGGNPKQEEGVDIQQVAKHYMQYIKMEKKETILKPENKSTYPNITISSKTNNKPNTGKTM